MIPEVYIYLCVQKCLFVSKITLHKKKSKKLESVHLKIVVWEKWIQVQMDKIRTLHSCGELKNTLEERIRSKENKSVICILHFRSETIFCWSENLWMFSESRAWFKYCADFSKKKWIKEQFCFQSRRIPINGLRFATQLHNWMLQKQSKVCVW